MAAASSLLSRCLRPGDGAEVGDEPEVVCRLCGQRPKGPILSLAREGAFLGVCHTCFCLEEVRRLRETVELDWYHRVNPAAFTWTETCAQELYQAVRRLHSRAALEIRLAQAENRELPTADAADAAGSAEASGRAAAGERPRRSRSRGRKGQGKGRPRRST